MLTGTRDQLAAILVNEENSFTGPSLIIHGTPGDWSVAARPVDAESVWLASERQKTSMRSFKTLDAANAAACAVYRLAFPLRETTSVRIVTSAP